MKLCAWLVAFTLVCGVAGLLTPDTPAAPTVPGLTVDPEGRLLKNGKPYRAIGVNYFDAFYRVLRNPKDTSYEAGFAELARFQVPFVRVAFSAFWPAHWQAYFDDKEEYFSRLDAVVRAAEKNGVGLVPDLFWATASVSDVVGEPYNQWGNPDSKTVAFMRTYTREVVTRYRESPAILAWEFGNEMSNKADLPNASAHRPPVVPALGTPSARGANDDLTLFDVRTACVQFAQEVRKLDLTRPISSGHSIPRPEAFHMRLEKSFKPDTPEQGARILAELNPDPVNLVSVHVYNKSWERLPLMAATARRLRKPLFIGEFGVQGESAAARDRFANLLTSIEKSGVPLAAVWVYDRKDKDPFNVTGSNEHAYQLEMLTAVNKRLSRP